MKYVQKFFGLTGYYRKCFKDYDDIAKPKSDLVRKHNFKWENELKEDFINLNTSVVTNPELPFPRIGVLVVVTTVALKFACRDTLEPEGHTVAYLLHRFTEAETS